MTGESPLNPQKLISQHLADKTGYELCLSQLYCSVQNNLQPWEINVQEVFKFLDSGMPSRRTFDYTDPVYGRVKLSPEILDIIDTAPMRRLGAVSQMTVGMTSKGQGIDHTRLTHSIGVSILGDRMADHLGLDRHERNTLKVCGLLHDIRHGPFSHLYDHMTIDGVYFDHDSRSIDFLKEPGLEIALRGLGLTPEEIFSNLTDKREGSNQLALPLGYLAKEVLDRVDYLRRDTAAAKFIPSDCLRAINQICDDLLQVLEYNRDENLMICREEDLEVVRRFNMWRGFAFQVLPFDRATQVVNAFIRREADRSFAHMAKEERNLFLKESTSYTDQQFMEKFSPDARRILKSGHFEQNFAVLNIIKADMLTPHGVEQLRVHPTLHLIREVCGADFCANFDPLVVRRPKPASSVTFNVQSSDGYIEARSVQPLALPEELEEMTHGHLKPGRIPHGCDSSEVMVVCYKGSGSESQLIMAQHQIEQGLIERGLIKPRENTIAQLETLVSHNIH
jgi:HD superfamily phosphohydrolase